MIECNRSRALRRARRARRRTAIAPCRLFTTTTQQLHRTLHGNGVAASNDTRHLAHTLNDLRVHVTPLPPMLAAGVATVGTSRVGLAIEHKRSCAESAV
jgi:hypothetical protein